MYDNYSGLVNYGFRDYSPISMRFTTVDPVKDGTNWYAYVGNDPINFIDLWGLSASDNQGWSLQNVADGFKTTWDITKNLTPFKSATAWHFENRENANSNLPEYDDHSQPNWRVEPLDTFHQDDTRDGREIKLTNTDGREVVYYGDTKEIVEDHNKYGTYNHVVVLPKPEDPTDIGGWIMRGASMLGHGVLDVVPYLLGGSVRGKD
jgi:hypothetical protein